MKRNSSEIDVTIFDDIAVLFEYPKDDIFPVLSSLIKKFSELPEKNKIFEEKLKIVFDYFSSNPIGTLEEDYIATFEMNTKYILYIGHILFGENYERSAYISQLNEIYNEHGFEIDNKELPDHIAVILKFLSKKNVSLEKGKQLLNNLIEAFTIKANGNRNNLDEFLLNLESKNKFPVLYSALIDLAELVKTWEIN